MRCNFRSMSCVTLSLGLLVILLVLNYLSVSSENSNLTLRMRVMEKQLRNAEDQGREAREDLLDKEAAEMAMSLHQHEGNINKMNNKLRNKLGPGQLKDVNPAAVRVRKKETEGMVFHKDKSGHYLPILPQGNPLLPRGKPEHSVMDIIKAGT